MGLRVTDTVAAGGTVELLYDYLVILNMDTLVPILIVLGWFVLVRWVLPRAGVPT